MNDELVITKDFVESEIKKKLQLSFDFFSKSIASIKGGKVDPSIVEYIKVEAYGNKVILSQVASVSLQSAKVMLVNVWDVANLNNVKKAIIAAELGFNVIAEGSSIKLNIPDLSEDSRKKFVKVLKAKGEEAKTSFNNIRRKEVDVIKKAKISEDDKKRYLEIINKYMKDYMDEFEKLVNKKSKDIME